MLVEGFFPRVGVGREADQPAVGLSGVWAAVCPRCGHHALLGRLPDRASPRGDRRERDSRRTTIRPGPTSCCSTAACSSRRCCASGCWKCWEVGSISQTSRASSRAPTARRGSRSCWTTIGSIWPSPAARPITAWCGAARACASPPAWPARITLGDGVASRRCPPDAVRPLLLCVAAPANRAGPRRGTEPSDVSICWSPSRPSFRCSSPARG